MSFNTFRRYYLDRSLEGARRHLQGKVLDIGGVKINRRGRFQISAEDQVNWTFINNNPASGATVIASVPPLPFPDESYRSVLITEVLEYIENVPALMHEVHRVLEPSGTVVMSVPFVHPLHGDAEYDCWRFTETGIKKAVAPYFEITEFQILGGFWAVTADLVLNLAKQRPTLLNRFLIKVINLLHPLILFLDKPLRSVNTGFFLVMTKKTALP